MKKTVDVGKVTRKIIKMIDLPEGFLYFTDTHIVQGTGKVVYVDDMREGVVIGMKDNTILVGTKKGPTAATEVPKETLQ